MRKYLLWSLTLISLVIALRAWAGFDEGVRAYEQGDYATALREWRPLAEQGHAEAQRNLGGMYYFGKGVLQDYHQATQWVRRAAEQGLHGAQFLLGLMYYEGTGVLQSDAEAVQWFHRSAEQGNAGGQFYLGLMYLQGRGVPQDDTRAMQWFQRAADQGGSTAQNNLGVMYSHGRGVPQDYSQAVAWFRRAADQGHAEAQNNLCAMYGEGKGIPQDFMQAYFWCNLAAANLTGPARGKAVRNRDKFAARLSPAQLTQAQALAREWRLQLEMPDSAAPALSQWRSSMSVSSSPRRDLIRQVQERLQAQGFTPGAIDGSIGLQTQQALRRFQSTKGLLPTGALDEKTLDALGLR